MNLPHGRVSIAVVTIALSVLTGCGVESTETPGVASTVSADGQIQSCQSLIDAGWTAPPNDPSFAVDPETGVTDVSFGEGETLRLDVLGDPACVLLPDIGSTLSRVFGHYEQIRVEECTDAVQDLIAGEAPRKEGVPVDMNALRRHVLQWCPPAFGQQLRDAGVDGL